MIVSFENGDLGVIIFDFLWLEIPAVACDSGNELVVVTLGSPLLDSFFVRPSIEHERVHGSRNLAFVLAGDLSMPLFRWSVHPCHHVFHRYIIVLGHHTQRLSDLVLQRPIFALAVFAWSRRL